MIASSFFDPMLGIDVHWELVPTPAPVPTPIPNPFTGLVRDFTGLAAGLVISNAIGAAMGAPFKGPVLYWTAFPATNTGTEGKHVPGHILLPPGTAWAPVPKTPKPTIHPGETPKPPKPVVPDNDAVMITGSKTVHVMGSNACRIGDLALSCSEPVRLPSTVVLPVPKGAPILIGGPPTLDLMAAALASLRTRFIGDSIQSAISRLRPSRFRSALQRAACFFTGHPVDVATGKLVTSAVDFALPGPLPLRFERCYQSNFASRGGPLGHGWSHSLDQAVWEERGKVVLLDEEGREVELDTFDLPERRLREGEEAFQPIDRLTFRREARGKWRVTAADGTVREFGPVPGRADDRARLQRIASRCGHHEIALTYDARGRLEWVRDSGGRLIGFEHDERDRLVAIKLPLAHERGWATHRRFDYDAEGDLVGVTDSQRHAWRFEYVTHLMVRETDRTGLSFYFEYDGLGEDAWCTRTWGDGGIYDHVLKYDKKNHVTFVTDSLGHTTQYQMNAAAMVVAVVDPLGAKTVYEYDMESRREVAVVDPLGGRTERTFDARGNLVRAIGPDGSVHEVEWDAAGRPVTLRDPLGHAQHYAYDERGCLVAHWRPDGTHAHYQWKDGLLDTVMDGDGHATRLAHDAQGQLRRIVLPSGGALEYRYDGRGRLVRADDSRGGGERLRYDAEDRLVEHTAAIGSTRSHRYDAEGNLLESVDAHRRIRLGYTHFHKVAWREEAEQRLSFEYDSEDRLVGVVNPAGERYGLELDRVGRVAAEVGFDGGRTTHARDLAGRVTRRALPSGRTSAVRHDATGRPIEVVHDDGTTVRFVFDARGDLVEAVSDAAHVRIERDALGRVVRESQDGGESWVRVRYGAGGRRAEVETSLGARQRIERDPLAEVARLVNGSCALSFERDALGQERAREMPGGVRVEWERDAAGRPTLRRTTRRASTAGPHALPSELEARVFQWRGHDQLAAILDPVGGPRFFDHDGRGRVIRERTDRATVERAMDAAGNVYRRADRADRRYGAGGVLLEAEAVDGSGTVTYAHDADGNLTERVEPDGTRFVYRYDGQGLLVEVERFASGQRDPELRLAFAYDAFARRVRKTVSRLGPTGEELDRRETRFVWDGDVVAHELDSHEGLTTWYWDPDADIPVAKQRGDRTWSIAPDPIGTPTEMYDEVGELAWKMQLDVFGVPRFDAGGAGDCPWRWPGQYEDLETGEHYNRWRFYHSGTGAFGSKDPLGLVGSVRPFGYVEDPLVETDPDGLAARIVGGFFAARHEYGRGRSPAGRVRIPYQGSRSRDFTLADRMAGFTPDNPRPANYTWHHVDYNPRTGHGTMQLVLTSVHDSVSHAGGVSAFRRATGIAYDTAGAIRHVEDQGRLKGRPCGG